MPPQSRINHLIPSPSQCHPRLSSVYAIRISVQHSCGTKFHPKSSSPPEVGGYRNSNIPIIFQYRRAPWHSTLDLLLNPSVEIPFWSVNAVNRSCPDSINLFQLTFSVSPFISLPRSVWGHSPRLNRIQTKIGIDDPPLYSHVLHSKQDTRIFENNTEVT